MFHVPKVAFDKFLIIRITNERATSKSQTPFRILEFGASDYREKKSLEDRPRWTVSSTVFDLKPDWNESQTFATCANVSSFQDVPVVESRLQVRAPVGAANHLMLCDQDQWTRPGRSAYFGKGSPE